MSNNLPALLGGGGVFPLMPKPRGNNVIGRLMTNIELEQLKKQQTLQADTIEQFVRGQRLQQQFIIDQVTANERVKAELDELKARQALAQSTAELSMIDVLERRLEFQQKKKAYEASGE